MTDLRCIKLIIEYDGSAFAGFQRQKKELTIQGVLEDSLSEICRETINMVGAARTDAGVHAVGQVCHFKTKSLISCEKLRQRLNALLRPSIVIREACDVSEKFHARYSALAKEYAYFILNRPFPSAFFHPYLHWFPFPLDEKKMGEACQFLVGKKDFSSFQASAGKEKNPVVEIFKAQCFRGTRDHSLPFSHLGGEVITFCIQGTRFLHHMVRNIVGTLLEIGENKRSPQEMQEILNAKDRRAAGPTAPAKGLFLMKIYYPKEFE